VHARPGNIFLLLFENELAGALGTLNHVLLLGVLGVHVHVKALRKGEVFTINRIKMHLHLHSLVLLVEFAPQRGVVVGAEAPGIESEELQYTQTRGDLLLHPQHARKREEDVKGIRSHFKCHNLQSLLAKDQHQEVKEVGGQPVEKGHVEVVVVMVGGDTGVRVPEAGVEGDLLVDALAHLDHSAHGHLPVVRVGDVVNGYVGRTLGLLVELVGYDDQSVDGIVHGNHLGLVLLVDQDGPDHALAAPDHQASRSVQVVHPSGQRLVGSWGD